jgi:RNA polymerase sigma factor (sigma-70 family)
MWRKDLNASDRNDEELMIAYQKGHSESFDILYHRYKKNVFSFIKKRAKDTNDANEIFQQVFLKLHKSRLSFNPQYKFIHWLFTICRTSLADFYRSKPRGFFEELSEDLLKAPDQIAALENAEHYRSLLSSELNPVFQEAVALRVFNEESYEEIALKLNLSEQNVRQIVSRSLKKLKSIIGQE